jgi:hypothetical protein
MPEERVMGVRGGEVGAVERAVNRRLDRALQHLRALPNLHGPSHSVRTDLGGLECRRNPPAAPEVIAEAELTLGTALPQDYRQFLRCCDGAMLFVEGTGGPTSTILFGTADLVRHAEETERTYQEWCIPELVVFASVGDEGDWLAFETARMNPYGGCGVLDARQDCRPDQWWVIARDFTSWLEEVLADIAGVRSFGRLWSSQPTAWQPELPFHEDDRL